MSDPNLALQALLQGAGFDAALFAPNSRYYGVAVASLQTSDGKTVVYLRRRFVPAPESIAAAREHVITQGERPDHLAARYIGDAEQYWRMCDANGVSHPDELTATPGVRVRVPTIGQA